MRTLAFVVALMTSAPAFATSLASLAPRLSLGVPQLSLSVAAEVVSAGLDLGDLVPTATPSIVVPPRYGFIIDDGRAFWFSAGASSVVALGSHVVIGLPLSLILFFGPNPTVSLINNSSPAATVPFLIGVGGGYMLVQCAVSALAATLVFNNVSKIYDANYLVSLSAHIAGSLLGAGVSALTVGVGVMLVSGLGGLVEFTGSAGVGAIIVFSFLGLLPAVVIGGIALVGVPAIVSAWAMSVSAAPKAGFAINPQWKDPLPESASSRTPALPLVSLPLLTIPLPG